MLTARVFVDTRTGSDDVRACGVVLMVDCGGRQRWGTAGDNTRGAGTAGDNTRRSETAGNDAEDCGGTNCVSSLAAHFFLPFNFLLFFSFLIFLTRRLSTVSFPYTSLFGSHSPVFLLSSQQPPQLTPSTSSYWSSLWLLSQYLYRQSLLLLSLHMSVPSQSSTFNHLLALFLCPQFLSGLFGNPFN